MSTYVNFDHIMKFLSEARRGTKINKSPFMDNALLNLQQLLQHNIYSPSLFEVIEIGGCDSCRWKRRTQKCSCCRRNLRMKDCYERLDVNDSQ